MRAAGAVFIAVWKGLRCVRWRRFASLHFWVTAVVVVAVGQFAPRPANAPSGAAQVDRASLPKVKYFSFTDALLEAYREQIARERAALGSAFDDTLYRRNTKLLETRAWPEPPDPSALGIGGPTGIAIDEARVRLLRLYSLDARETYPRQSAAAQVALECWAARALARRDRAAIGRCADRYYNAVVVLEEWLLPIRTFDPFERRLAREYLAYANYKATVEGDLIDARHFARKGLQAADAQGKIEPEALDRWFESEGPEVTELGRWRGRLESVLAKYRTGSRAIGAAVALARFDCWVERTAGHEDFDHVAQCRGDFISLMRQLEDAPLEDAKSFRVRFPYDQLALDAAERETVADAARAAIERNAVVNVAALAWRQGDRDVATREAWRRGETVAAMLETMGVPGERIHLLERQALPKEDQAGFRRVDIILD